MRNLAILGTMFLLVGCMELPDRDGYWDVAEESPSDPEVEPSDEPGDPGGGVTEPTDGEDPPSRPVNPRDDDSPEDTAPAPEDEPVDEAEVDVELSPPGGACDCDGDCRATSGYSPLCIHGICGVRATDDACPAGSDAACPAGHRCWSGTGQGVCYPDYVPGQCAGAADGDGSCVSDGARDCYRSCGTLCDLPGIPPDRTGDADSEPAGEPDSWDESDGELGPCSGSPAECQAARVINAYRAGHIHAGECNTPLRWNDHLGRLAHDHQSGPFVRHSRHGYVENVGMSYDGVRGTAEYIIQFEPWSEPHCASDGSYVMSHHCAAMFCNNETVGVGVYQQGDAVYMTMIFGDASGNPSW